MNETQLIIRIIDKHLEETGEDFITPPAANQLLEARGILKDRSARSGNPLRRFLRAGKIPHAYQEGRFWRIPHS